MLKTCTHCHTEKDEEEFYWKRPGQRQSWCKECRNAESTARWIEKRDKRRAEKAALDGKNCTTCGVFKPFAEFHRRGARFKSACRTCRVVEKKTHREANREAVNAQAKGYYDSNRPRIAARQKKAREENPDRDRVVHQRWRSANKSTVNANTHKRRARLKGNGGEWTAAEWEALKAKFGNRCLMCGKTEPEIKLSVDHVVPVTAGGPNTIGNIQPLCKPCNSRKSDKILDLRPTEEVS